MRIVAEKTFCSELSSNLGILGDLVAEGHLEGLPERLFDLGIENYAGFSSELNFA